MLGGIVRFHVPHRIKEGYGMQGSVLEIAAQENIRLVVSVDTGMRAFAEAEIAKRLGLDLIITDHHLPEADASVPDALAVLNPNQSGCGYPCKHLCGAGVAFKLAQALLAAQDPDRTQNKILPSFLKMLAIATVADAVPLLGENRIIAAVGLEELRRPMAAGLRALMQVAKLDPTHRRLTTTDVAFRLAPRINAAGRMDVASEVVELFTTRDHGRAQELAAKLDRLNTERRETELAALEEIEHRLELDEELKQAHCLVIDGDNWHRGVIGILASRVVDRTARPALVITYEGEVAHGSGRSIPGFHLLEALESCADLFSRFGGHAHAVGFRLPADRIPELRRRLNEYAAAKSEGEEPAVVLECHAELPLDRITPAVYGWLRKLEPMGIGNPDPVLIAYKVRVASTPRIIKERHIRLQLSQGPRGASFPALGWHWAERIEAMGIIEGSIIDVAYRLRENEHPEFGGLELEIAGVKLAEI
jgi:single-stranded-DNA-specific exonuclease